MIDEELSQITEFEVNLVGDRLVWSDGDVWMRNLLPDHFGLGLYSHQQASFEASAFNPYVAPTYAAPCPTTPCRGRLRTSSAEAGGYAAPSPCASVVYAAPSPCG